MKKNIFLVLVMLSAGYAALAQQVKVETNNQPGWHKIAQTVVNLKEDRDEVTILGDDRFKALRLNVSDGPVEFTDLSVVYANGTPEDIPVRSLIKAGGQTREIDLKGTDRAVKKIILMYKTVPNPQQDKARVEIWGLK